VEYKGNHQLLITFTNKEVKQFDLNGYLDYPVYEPLKDEAFCKNVIVSDGVIVWDEDIDFDPDTLYLESKSLQISA